jgi:hypothetical protein
MKGPANQYVIEQRRSVDAIAIDSSNHAITSAPIAVTVSN